MNEGDKAKLWQAAELIRQVMIGLDKGTVACPHCGTVKAADPEARAQWDPLNAALTRVEKVINWTPWE